MSQPIVYDNDMISSTNNLFRTSSVQQPKQRRREGISEIERDMKIAQLENFIKSNIDITESDIDEGQQTVDEIVITQDNSEIKPKFFYFIGRLNPPHNGHIKALEELVKMANSQTSIPPLILLGSGPGSLRTMDNPITYEAKVDFIRRVLPGNYIIEKMTNPAQNVSEYIRRELGESILNIENIDITHIAGGKDEDTTKLAFALKSAEKTARGLVPEANISTGVAAIEAETSDTGDAMSATKVRKDAYRSVLNGKGFEEWQQKYGNFYGENAEQIYNEIIFPIQEIPESDRMTAIEKYINEGTLPSTGAKKRKRGGARKKTRKYKRKTQKRKRRATRRKY